MANELTYQSVFTGQEMDERFTAVAQLQAALLEVETALSAKYVKPASGIPETDLDSAVQSALAKARSAVQDLSNYYTTTEIDSLLAAVNSQEYVDVATLPTASASTLGKIYLVGPTNNQYDRYYTSYDGSAYSWVAAGSTEINLSNYATKAELNQLDQELYGKKDVILQNVTTAPSTVYITNEMVSPGDVLLFELESINNLTGVLRAEKTGYVFDTSIYVDAGQTASVRYTVPQDFLRIYTQSTANPMKIVVCRYDNGGDLSVLDERMDTMETQMEQLPSTYVAKTSVLQDTGTGTDKVVSQDAVTRIVDSPFASVPNAALKGLVSFRMNNVSGNGMPVDNYTLFRISSIYIGGAWNMFMQMQKSADGTTWSNYDTIERLASAAPSPLPVIEEITSKYGAFTVIVNWPMMGNASLSGLSLVLKRSAPNYFVRKLQEQIDTINLWPTWNDYELKDRTKQIVKVDASGNGDFTTIAAAYASITDSSYGNQYEVVVYPGTYNEYNLIPPKFTHTHGLIPGTVIVTSEGVSSTLPVFDQRVPCKLSNMKIVSGTGYCVHQDQTTLHGIALVNENLHCKKVYGADVSNFAWRPLTNPSVLGIGASLYGAKFVWNNCIFENGWAASHSVGGDETTPANQHLIYHNCKLVNAMLNIQAVGNSAQQGNYVCEVDGLITEFGRPSAVCVPRARNAGDTTYQFPWQIIGGGNKNFVVLTLNIYDTSIDDVWPNINTADIILVQMANGVSVSKGQFVDVSGNVCNASTPVKDVIGMAVEDGAAGASVRVHIGSFALDNSGVSGAFPNVANDGEYGIGADGRLSANATDIIGVVKYNNFYRIIQ